MRTTQRPGLADRLSEAVGRSPDLPALADAVCAAVAEEVPFAFGCFAVTDPASGLLTRSFKTHPLGIGDEEFAAAEYGPPDVNSLVEIEQREPPVGVLSLDTGAHPERCRRYRDFLHPRFGFTDELRLVLRSRAVPWGVLALYRGDGEPTFTVSDARQVAAVGSLVAGAIQRVLFAPGPVCSALGAAPRTSGNEPAVLILDAADRVTQLTQAAGSAVEELGGWDHGSPPTGILAVSAVARSRPGPATTRARSRSGSWLSLRAAPLAGPDGRSDVVVTIEPTPPGELGRLTLAAHGLTAREEEVAALVLRGASTRAIAAALHLSPHTVQDHLKAVFAKLGINSRRELVARIVLG